MVVVPAGEFMMGSPESEKGRGKDEGPQRKVTFAQPFAVGKFEVTFAQWDACTTEGGCTHKPDDQTWGRGKRPVINVVGRRPAIVAWLAKKTGKPYRLPTEAEWEYWHEP
jgi:formylglycine-generating enzyme required for sulfatase activity